MTGQSSVDFTVFRELMDGANQYKDRHEVHPRASFPKRSIIGKDG